jgi:hypothetical protein
MNRTLNVDSVTVGCGDAPAPVKRSGRVEFQFPRGVEMSVSNDGVLSIEGLTAPSAHAFALELRALVTELRA